MSGNFASVYEVRNGASRLAVRCFLRQVPGQEKRYTALNQHLAVMKLPCLVGFEYLPQGIRVKGQWYPIVKMEWSEGEALHLYVERYVNDGKTLLNLLAQWRGLVNSLSGCGIAHGDLQHGNVLVTANGQIALVDYDAMYVPALRGQDSPELGHENFQHPQRKPDDFSESLDNFAALVIYTSLRALAADPGLWQQYHTGENLIFGKKDFLVPKNSPVFRKLAGSPDKGVRLLAEALMKCCLGPITQVPALETLVGELPPPLLPAATSARFNPAQQVVAAQTQGVVGAAATGQQAIQKKIIQHPPIGGVSNTATRTVQQRAATVGTTGGHRALHIRGGAIAGVLVGLIVGFVLYSCVSEPRPIDLSAFAVLGAIAGGIIGLASGEGWEGLGGGALIGGVAGWFGAKAVAWLLLSALYYVALSLGLQNLYIAAFIVTLLATMVAVAFGAGKGFKAKVLSAGLVLGIVASISLIGEQLGRHLGFADRVRATFGPHDTFLSRWGLGEHTEVKQKNALTEKKQTRAENQTPRQHESSKQKNEAAEATIQTVTKQLPGEWHEKMVTGQMFSNEKMKLLITMESGRLTGNIVNKWVEEKLGVDVRSDGLVVLKGVSYRLLSGRSYNLDTLYGRISDDGRSMEGEYEDRSGKKGKWSVSKVSNIHNGISDTSPKILDAVNGSKYLPTEIKDFIKNKYIPAKEPKAIALAIDSNGRWVGHLTDKRSSQGEANKFALSGCRGSLSKYKVASSCKLYAIGDKVVWSEGDVSHMPSKAASENQRQTSPISQYARKRPQVGYIDHVEHELDDLVILYLQQPSSVHPGDILFSPEGAELVVRKISGRTASAQARAPIVEYKTADGVYASRP
jgi:hypothetical protein